MKLFFLIKEGFSGFSRARLAGVITILTISVSLSLLGIFGVLMDNLTGEFQRRFNKINLAVFVDPTLTDSQIRTFQNNLDDIQAVESVRYISPDEAIKTFQGDFGGDITEVLGNENPFSPEFHVTLKSNYSSLEKVESVVAEIETLQAVDEVIYEKNIISLINKYAKTGLIIAISLGAIILFISIMLIFNTIRLTIHSRKNVIEIMRLVGATNSFIKAPFIIEGFLQGMIGSLFASSALWVFSNIIKFYLLPSLLVPWNYFAFLILAGMLLGLLGSYFSTGKYLKY